MKMKFDDDEPSDWEALKKVSPYIILIAAIVAIGHYVPFLINH